MFVPLHLPNLEVHERIHHSPHQVHLIDVKHCAAHQSEDVLIHVQSHHSLAGRCLVEHSHHDDAESERNRVCYEPGRD